MVISSRILGREELEHFLTRDEDQFFDRKRADIAPAKASQSLSAFANADGGELLIGVADDGTWYPFQNVEDANDMVRVASETLQPRYYEIEFLHHPEEGTVALLFYIERHPGLVSATTGNVYLREGAQNLHQKDDSLEALKRAKGGHRYELTKTDIEASELGNTETMIDFMVNGDVFAEPLDFLTKNVLVQDGHGTVASTLLFADLPQAYLPSSAVKLYRYRTEGPEDRDHLDGKPETIEGPITSLIERSRNRVSEIVSGIPRLGTEGFTNVHYPTETLHEILTNAFLHRDYGIADYVHVRIFDNRIEVDSPGRLHGHVTVQNILDERSARNPQIQRIVNKFPDAPNKDIGEGLNTAFQAMENLRLSHPQIQELSDRVRVTIRHEPLASPQTAIMDAVIRNGSINNSEARDATKIIQERTIRRHFEELQESGQLTRRGTGRGTRYYPTEAALSNSSDDG